MDELKHNFKQIDVFPYAKDGTLRQNIVEIFGEEKSNNEKVYLDTFSLFV